MQTINKLTELIEQAASSIILLSPEDLPEVESLQTILDEIDETIAEKKVFRLLQWLRLWSSYSKAWSFQKVRYWPG